MLAQYTLMVDTLCNHLAEKPGLYVEEIALFLWEEFRVLPSSSSVKRAPARAGWTKKKVQQKAKEQNPQFSVTLFHVMPFGSPSYSTISFHDASASIENMRPYGMSVTNRRFSDGTKTGPSRNEFKGLPLF